MDNKVINLEYLKKASIGEIVPIGGFNGEGFINVRLKRPSMLNLAAKGDIPNTLLNVAYDLFYGTDEKAKTKENKGKDLEGSGKVYAIFAEKALVEPTYKEIEEAGLTLNDTQLLQIWQYVNHGAKALEQFREIYEHNEDNKDQQQI